MVLPGGWFGRDLDPQEGCDHKSKNNSFHVEFGLTDNQRASVRKFYRFIEEVILRMYRVQGIIWTGKTSCGLNLGAIH